MWNERTEGSNNTDVHERAGKRKTQGKSSSVGGFLKRLEACRLWSPPGIKECLAVAALCGAKEG